MTPPDAPTLNALADRAEAAEKPDRKLFEQVYNVCFPDPDGAKGRLGWLFKTQRFDTFLDASSYLDAAAMLADGFVLLHLSDIGADGLPLAILGDPTTTPPGEWRGISSASGCPINVKLALALTAASLRARAAALQMKDEV